VDVYKGGILANPSTVESIFSVGLCLGFDNLTLFCVVEKSNTWIPLDEYYYGKKEGDPTYREDKGEYRFRVIVS